MTLKQTFNNLLINSKRIKTVKKKIELDKTETKINLFKGPEPLELESQHTLKDWQLAYTTYGKLNQNHDNVVWVMHAFSANSDPAEWWPGMVGDGKYFNPKEHYIVCANILGSCYGSTGPNSINSKTNQPYGRDFPLITNKDNVKAFDLLRQHLGIERIKFTIGASLGGQQMLEWAILQPDLFEIICPVSTNARFSPWGIAFNESQRMALELDSTLWETERENAGSEGIKVARAIAMLSYRTYKTYQESQLDEEAKIDAYRAASYQRYQGLKLSKRFTAQSYWYLSKMMDSHDVGRHREGLVEALKGIKAKAFVLGVSSDQLFPKHEQEFLAKHIPNAEYIEIDSFYGHDGFLIEFDQLIAVLEKILS